MTALSLRETLHESQPPAGLSLALQALWWDARGNWERAHECAQAQDDAAGATVHAYLHRKEGDLPNARYWYARAGRAAVAGPLEAEWDSLISELSA